MFLFWRLGRGLGLFAFYAESDEADDRDGGMGKGIGFMSWIGVRTNSSGINRALRLMETSSPVAERVSNETAKPNQERGLCRSRSIAICIPEKLCSVTELDRFAEPVKICCFSDSFSVFARNSV